VNVAELPEEIQAGYVGIPGPDQEHHEKDERHKAQKVEEENVTAPQAGKVDGEGGHPTADVTMEKLTESVPATVEVPQLQGRSEAVSEWVVDLSSFDLVRTVTSGSQFATEIRRDSSTGVEIAVKCFPQLDASNEQVFFQEIEALVRLDHPCIVPFFGYVPQTQTTGPKIAIHFMSGGSLSDLLESRPNWWDGTAKSIVVAGIVRGMRAIHDSGIIHRDLKPSTVLLDAARRPRICGFGSNRDQCLTSTLTGQVETPWYMAPELYDAEDYNEKVDIYSFALMLYEVVVGRPVFPRTLTLASLKAKVSNGERAEIPGGLEDIVADVIQEGWSQDKNDRPSFADIYDKLRQNDFCVDREGFNSMTVGLYIEWVEAAVSQ
jgi:serine/threonine protein kinase